MFFGRTVRIACHQFMPGRCSTGTRYAPVPGRVPGRDCSVLRSLLDQRLVGLGPPIAEELPGVAGLLDHLEVEIGYDDLVLVAAGLDYDLPLGLQK